MTSVSLYLVPFSCTRCCKNKVLQKSDEGANYDKMYLNFVDEKWINKIDLVVLLIGHWFLKPLAYYEGDLVLGNADLRENELQLHHALRKALRITLKSIIDKRDKKENDINVVMKHFHHVIFKVIGIIVVFVQRLSFTNKEKDLEVMHVDICSFITR
ncbi:hypothetical protein MTR_4g102570 [Medicago truncatula]|uniref:Trichome birefringence-like C-terminal domain-containing protein n=2 Tax=Medicago truncatula TaxID=3880 RepID=A0A072URJ7_MEDTR|nr:hypothetical protein MTR_4g102570 [Medicago truncatula]